MCHAIDHEQDALRHGQALSRDPLHFRGDRPISDALYKAFDSLLGFTGLPERERLSHVSREYEEAWGRFQGCTRVLDDLDRLVFAESAQPGIVAEVRKRYRGWLKTAEDHIDAMAEQFPEFVNAVQERLARRLLVHAEAEIVEAEARVGSIPEGVREKVIENLNREIRHLKGEDISQLRLDPGELLRKVPFFHDMPEDDFHHVAARLVQRTIPAGKTIIRQGERGETLYLIARGVVRVSQDTNGEEHDLATLLAGDFFGEMALLRQEPRVATCRAVLPTAVYALVRKDFDEVCLVCPGIQAALEQTDRERRKELEEITSGENSNG